MQKKLKLLHAATCYPTTHPTEPPHYEPDIHFFCVCRVDAVVYGEDVENCKFLMHIVSAPLN